MIVLIVICLMDYFKKTPITSVIPLIYKPIIDNIWHMFNNLNDNGTIRGVGVLQVEIMLWQV